MKRTLSLLTCIILLLSSSACGSSLPPVTSTDTGTETAEETVTEAESTIPEIPEANRLSKQKIASFPIANSSMTEDELRNLCVEFFRFSQSFAWTPDENWKYGKDPENPTKTLMSGAVYGGFPYLLGTGNVYRMAEFYDEATGVVNMSKAGANQRHFGNFCSYGSGWGFSRVVNSATHELTQDMVPKNGYIPVGPYQMDLTLEQLEKNATVDICTENGKDVMFASYAELKPADALVSFTSGGHVIMCSEVHVVKKSDGSINPDKSYIRYLDQGSSWSFRKMENGKNYQVQGGIDKSYSFSTLYQKCYIPYTFGEFLGTDPVEEGSASLQLPSETPSAEQLSESVLRANYMISDVFMEVLDGKGDAVMKRVIRTENGGIKAVRLSSFGVGFPTEYASAEYTVRISAQIGNGQLLTAWEGHLSAK